MELMHGSQADLEFYLMKQKLSNMILRLKFAILMGRISDLRLLIA